MMRITELVPVLLLVSTGVAGEKDSVFVYSTLGGVVLLPCTKATSSNCSSITWTFFKGGRVRYSVEVSGGRVSSDSDKANRTGVTSNCSLVLRGLVEDDTGSYLCLENQQPMTDIYLSLLSISSASPITQLQEGGRLALSCVLFTYYDAGSCKSYSNVFRLQWLQEDGTLLPHDSRYRLIENTRCNITLLTELQAQDDSRRWRCQVTTGVSRVAFVDFTSSFLFRASALASEKTQRPPVTEGCPAELPVSRILLCVALPLMVSIVGFFTWKKDQKKDWKSVAVMELQEVH